MRVNPFIILLAAADMASAAVLTVSKTVTVSCGAAITSILETVPTPTGDLVDYIKMAYSESEKTATSKDELSVFCHMTDSLPATLLSDWTSYTDAAHSWYSAKSPSLVSIATSCLSYDTAKASATVEALLKGLGASDCPSPTTTSTTKATSASTMDILESILEGAGVTDTSPTMTTALNMPLITGTSTSKSLTETAYTALTIGPLGTSSSNSTSGGGIILVASMSTAAAAAAPRETGLHVVGLAAAGLLGAAILL